ncbi:GMC oxidoreductase [Laetiporus sulphureus 93-53]|uniref:GMC oxidoreductase n=1 Tax=Laetiporus sulphureus 93-53 TaxID=1314785 RepID=A0A165BWM8_9APHY|nr:GMC oxidoreductase [Laetiporus sulphureus 93-53]KZT01787.1 GMC oxidoreductase [Laetiporus sulphureus 93-53]
MSTKLASSADVADKKFDFVIIGGGTAGLALANKLSENKNVTVAVLEAGKAHLNDPLILNVNLWPFQMVQEEYNWMFTTVPQSKAANGQILWSRGKGLGGSTTMNLLMWTRPHREDIETIGRLGNPGWSWNRFYEYSKKTERYVPTEPVEPVPFKGVYKPQSVGHNGPIPISFAPTSSNAELPFQKSMQKSGFDVPSDTFSGEIAGTWKVPSIVDPETGHRSYSANGYLLPVIDRPNLKVLTEAYVTRVITSKKGDKVVAESVEFDYGEKIYKVNVGKEAILSAGTIKSPQILELSGIGDRKVLEKLGVAVQNHLPSVGENVGDKITAQVIVEMTAESNVVSSNLLADPAFHAKLRESLPGLKGDFPLLTTGVTFMPLQKFSNRADEIIAGLRSRISKATPELKEALEAQLRLLENDTVPDIEVITTPFILEPPVKDKAYILFALCLCHPFSRGSIHAKSVNAKDSPAIDPQYFTEPADLEILLDAVKFVRKVDEVPPFKDVVAREILPGPNVVTDDQMRETIKKNLATIWHTNGSLSMLPEGKGGAVDSKLKLYGTTNIRVVDMSVFPLPIGAHPQSAVYALAEQAGDVIKEEYKL